jgi:transposase-like protein
MEQNFRRLPIYDESFKRKVIEEYLSTGCQKKDLLTKYGIGGKGALQRWMQEYGYLDWHTKRKQKIKFAFPTPIPLSMPSDSQNIHELKKKILELERQLQDEKLRAEAYSRIIEKAEQELKIPIRKKPSTK